MNTRKIVILLGLLLPSCASMKGPNGEEVTLFMSNTGFSTAQRTAYDSSVGGMGNGLFADNNTKAAYHAPFHGPSGIHVGPSGIHINTIIDQGTPVDEIGEWTYKGLRSYFVLEGFRGLFDGYFGTEQATIEAAKDVDIAGIKGVTESERIAAGVEEAAIGAEIQKAAINTGGAE